MTNNQAFALGLAGVSTILALIAGWFTHVIVCLQTGKYLLLIAGGIVAPIGSIHGIGVWFGAWG